MLKLKEEIPTGIICVKDMKDGQIGVIVKWSNGWYLGRIVQRYDDYLICLDEKKGKSWGKFFASPNQHYEDCQVRILEKGEMLIVAEDEDDACGNG